MDFATAFESFKSYVLPVVGVGATALVAVYKEEIYNKLFVSAKHPQLKGNWHCEWIVPPAAGQTQNRVIKDTVKVNKISGQLLYAEGIAPDRLYTIKGRLSDTALSADYHSKNGQAKDRPGVLVLRVNPAAPLTLTGIWAQNEAAGIVSGTTVWSKVPE